MFLVILKQFYFFTCFFLDDYNTRLFGNFCIFSGMYDTGLNYLILYNYAIYYN